MPFDCLGFSARGTILTTLSPQATTAQAVAKLGTRMGFTKESDWRALNRRRAIRDPESFYRGYVRYLLRIMQGTYRGHLTGRAQGL